MRNIGNKSSSFWLICCCKWS